MGINFGSIGSIIKGGVEGFVLSGGNPAGAFAGAASRSQADQQKRRLQRQQEEFRKEQQKMAEIFGTGGLTSVQAPMAGQTTSRAGFGAGFGSFLTDVGKNIVSPFAGLATQIAPFFGKSVAQQPAITTTRNVGAQETQGSGSQEAFIGPSIQPLVNIGRQFLRSPVGQIGTGGAIGALTSFIGDDGKTIRITRKMKSQYRAVLNLAGGNYQLAADMLGVSDEFFISVMLKRFRNDGPVVTKAALRKTKQTVRRLKNMCDMYDSLRPTATRRRAPMKRATTTLISNK